MMETPYLLRYCTVGEMACRVGMPVNSMGTDRPDLFALACLVFCFFF